MFRRPWASLTLIRRSLPSAWGHGGVVASWLPASNFYCVYDYDHQSSQTMILRTAFSLKLYYCSSPSHLLRMRAIIEWQQGSSISRLPPCPVMRKPSSFRRQNNLVVCLGQNYKVYHIAFHIYSVSWIEVAHLLPHDRYSRRESFWWGCRAGFDDSSVSCRVWAALQVTQIWFQHVSAYSLYPNRLWIYHCLIFQVWLIRYCWFCILVSSS